MSGWAPKYFPAQLKVDLRARLQDKVMFGSDYPSIPYDRLMKEWDELGYSEAVMEKIFHQNAERILGL
jgi:predicted TIM-barrel fold metal-dependent hydrolase